MNSEKEKTYTRFRGYRFGSFETLTPEQLSALVEQFERPVTRTSQVLNGRGNVITTNLPGLGKVVIKRYMRGGLFRHLVRRKYVRWGSTRGEVEFDLLAMVRGLGVFAPEPVAFVNKGMMLYDAWLVTREIENRLSYAELGAANEERAHRMMAEMVRQLGILISNRIFHVDLHPGNVLVDDADRLYILDFDKAHLFRGPKNRLRDHYLVRWRRAVIKHQLPESLSEWMCPGLRRSFEDEAA